MWEREMARRAHRIIGLEKGLILLDTISVFALCIGPSAAARREYMIVRVLDRTF